MMDPFWQIRDVLDAMRSMCSDTALVSMLDDPRSCDWVETIELWQEARERLALHVWHGPFGRAR